MTLTLELDEQVVAKARVLAEQRNSSVSEVFSEAIQRIAPEEDRAAGFLALMDEIEAKGIGPLPSMTREERNARH